MLLWSWGANSHGQLGLNFTSEQVEIPTQVNIEFYECQIKQIVCGGGHSLLLGTDGKLFSCGWNAKLQLAMDNDVYIFERTWKLSGINFTNITCGWDFSCAITDDHFLFVWGSNSHGQLGLPRDHFSESVKPIRLHVNAHKISMGLRHTAIINSKGEIWVTGWGRHGQLGLGKDVLSCDKFTKVPIVAKISHIACGHKHTLGWSSDENALYVWGDNTNGQLLLDVIKYKKIFNPQKIDIDVRQGIRKLLSGWSNVLLWLEDGSIYTWGQNNCGQIGVENATCGKICNIKLPDGRQVKDVALGSEHTLCLATDNTLWAWGWNEHNNLGMKTEQEYVKTPTMVPLEAIGNVQIIALYAGGAHNFIVTEPIEKESDNKVKNS